MTTKTKQRPTVGIAVPLAILRKGKVKARQLGWSFSAYVSQLIHRDTERDRKRRAS